MKHFRIIFATLAILSLPLHAQENALDKLTVIDDVVQISTPEDFQNFAAAVNSGTSKLNAELTQDLNLDDVLEDLPMVGCGTDNGNMIKSGGYAGTFDGRFHTITYHKVTNANVWGLFGNLSGIICNLRVTGSITTDNQYMASLVNTLDGGIIKNCESSVDIITNSGDGVHGGLVRVTSNAGGKVLGCLYSGSMTGASTINSAAIVCFAEKGTEIRNCIFSGTMDIDCSNGKSYIFNRGASDACTNCYYVNETAANGNNNVTKIENEEIINGYACFVLNEGDIINPAWRQNIGEDSNPILDPTHKIVYEQGNFKCDGITPVEGRNKTYSNTEGGKSIEEHNFTNGVCGECGLLDPDYLIGNVFQIENANQFLSFAKLVQSGHNQLDAALTEDINLDDVLEDLPMVGYGTDNGNMIKSGGYAGTFDGRFHTITYHKVTNANIWGLFGSLSGTICNLRVTGSITTDNQYMASLVNTLDGGIIKNCESSVNIITNSGDGVHGGLVRVTSNAGGKVLGCLYSGSITGASTINSAAIVCFAEKGTEIRNCIFSGTMDIDCSNGKSYIFNRGASDACTNCYYVNETAANGNNNVTKIENEEMINGAACYILNEGNIVNPAWHQNIGEDDAPVLSQTGDIVYGFDKIIANVTDLLSLQEFAALIQTSETEKTEILKVQKNLIESLNLELEKLSSFDTVDDLLYHCNENILPLMTAITENDAAYNAFETKVNESIVRLEEYKDIDNEAVNIITDYLTDYITPDETYSNGSASCIIDERLLSSEELNAEMKYIDDMFKKMFSYDPQIGMEITNLFYNVDFSDGFNNWQGTKGTGSGISENSTIYAAESKNNALDISQTITGIKNGIYELQINGAFQPYPFSDLASTNYSAIFSLNDACNYFQTNIEDIISPSDAVDGENCYITPDMPQTDNQIEDIDGKIIGYTPSGVIGCSNAFNGGRYVNSILVNVADGTLTIGIKQLGIDGNYGWLGFGNIKVIYRGTLDEANDAMDHVLASQSARANTLLNTYIPSSGADYASYPNFSQALKDDLDSAMNAVETTDNAEEKYSLIQKFSTIFQQIHECKQAYISAIQQSDNIYTLASDLESYLNDDELRELYDLTTRINNNYMDGLLSMEEAKQNFMNNLSIIPDNIDGTYQISSARDFLVFSILVNCGNYDINAELTTDINLDEVIENLPMVGEGSGNGVLISSGAFAGIFDGKYHTITYHKVPTSDVWGLFGGLSGTIRNLHVCGTITTDYLYMAGIANTLLGGTIENCICDVDIITTSGNGFHGGLSRVTTTAGGKIIDCVYAGSITGPTCMSSAGILCFSECDVEIINCLFVGKLDIDHSNKKSYIITRNPSGAKISNCYYLNSTEANNNSETKQITEEQLINGEVRDLLNANRETPVWTQKDGLSYPTPFSNETSIQDTQFDTTFKSSQEIYNIIGQKVQKASKGIYIINGKKILFD